MASACACACACACGCGSAAAAAVVVVVVAAGAAGCGGAGGGANNDDRAFDSTGAGVAGSLSVSPWHPLEPFPLLPSQGLAYWRPSLSSIVSHSTVQVLTISRTRVGDKLCKTKSVLIRRSIFKLIQCTCTVTRQLISCGLRRIVLQQPCFHAWHSS